jgi:ribonuclease-3
MLFSRYPEKDEGKMTDLRSAIVRGKHLATISTKLRLPDFILLSRGEALAGGMNNPYILANTFEAFLGAIYLDLGFEVAQRFIHEHVTPTLDEILEKRLYVDPKSYLQEFTQAKWLITPNYEVLNESGLDHSKIYEVAVKVGEIHVGTGKGTSKKKAQEQAAEDAIGKIEIWEKTIKN